MMSPEAWYSLLVVCAVLAVLSRSRFPPDLVLMGGLAMLFVPGILTAGEALAGLANEGMVTVGLLFIVSAGIVETGGVTWISERLFGRPRSTAHALTRMMLPAAGLSGFMNNTPLVAMLIPAVNDWAKQHRLAPSKLMMPL
ncbi:MAG: SLC13 family permease, partial [Thermoguttaceae bacterium]|nr:SLC13 family permease [Thermoguttaceae bacterium]